MALGLAIAALAGIAMANYRLSRSVLYPPFVFSAMWALALTVYGAGLIEVDAIHNGLIVLILPGAPLFRPGERI
jgi:uncharacterized membrane protein YjjP (DUF1212 family)